MKVATFPGRRPLHPLRGPRRQRRPPRHHRDHGRRAPLAQKPEPSGARDGTWSTKMLSRRCMSWGVVLVLGCSVQELGSTSGDRTTNIAIDDEIGSICATKANGRYRCWNPDGAPVSDTGLPEGDYLRVQLATAGAVVPRATATFHTVGIPFPADLPPIANSCHQHVGLSGAVPPGPPPALFTTGTSISIPNAGGHSYWHVDDWPSFIDTTCAFEGLHCGVTRDGTAMETCTVAMAGGDWSQIAACR